MDSMSVGFIGSLIAIVVIVVVSLVLSVRIVKQYERLVVFRLGRTDQQLVREPGLRFVIPFVDRSVRVDMRAQLLEVEHRSAVTRDEQAVDVSARIEYRVVDPLAMVLAVSDLRPSVAARAVDILGTLVSETTSKEIRFQRDGLTERLRDRLAAEVDPLGVAVTAVVLT